MYISFLVHTLFYLPCSVYLNSLTSALRTKKVHVGFPSTSLFGLFAFSHKRFKNEKGSCIFPFSCTRFSTFPVRSICFLSGKRFKNEEGSCIFPSSCTRFSAFPVRSICFLSRKCFKDEEGSCSISFYLPCSVYLLSLASASRTRKVHVVFPFSCTRFSTFPVRSHHYSTLPVSQIDFL